MLLLLFGWVGIKGGGDWSVVEFVVYWVLLNCLGLIIFELWFGCFRGLCGFEDYLVVLKFFIWMLGIGVKCYFMLCWGWLSFEIVLVWYYGIVGRIVIFVWFLLYWRLDEWYVFFLFIMIFLLLLVIIVFFCSFIWYCLLLNIEKVFWILVVGYFFWIVFILFVLIMIFFLIF